MSTEIDERIVSMKFDNSQFEKGVAESIQTLNQLNSKLDFSDTSKSFSELEKAANKVTLSGLTESANEVELRFSAMSIATIAAIERIVDAAIDAGVKLVESLSTDQISSGFSKYEEKINATQAALNAVRDQGLGLDDVNAILDKLSWYSDETSYHFETMSSAMSQFIAAGVEVEGIEDIITGIGNACGLAGVNASKADYAFTALSRAFGQGYVSNQLWQNQLKTSGLTVSKEFKQILIDTAVEVGTLTDAGNGLYKTLANNDVTVTDINTHLSDMWLNTNVLKAAFTKFGKFSSAAYELCSETGIEASEAIKLLSGQMEEFSEAGFKAAQEARTFTDAIESVQEAVSARWSKTFELIIGDEEEAVELWTAVTEELLEVFAYGGDERNAILEEWKALGGRDDLLQGIKNAWEGILIVVSSVKDAFKELFPSLTGEKLQQMTKQFKDFTSKLQLSAESAYTLKVAIKALLLPIQLVFQVMRVGVSIVLALVVGLFQLVNSFLTLLATTNPIEDLFTRIFGVERYEKFMSAITTIFSRIKTVVVNFADNIFSSFKNSTILSSFASALNKILDFLSPIAGWIMDKIIAGLDKIANADFSKVTDFFSSVKKGLTDFKDLFMGIFDDLFGSANTFFTQFQGKTVTESIDLLMQKFLGIFNIASQFKTAINISGIFDSITDSTKGLTTAIGNVGNKIGDLVSKLSPAKILVFSFGAGISAFTLQMSNAAKAATTMFGSITNISKAITLRIKGNQVINISKAIITLAGALVVMALVDANRLRQATFSMITLMAGLVAMTGAISLINSKLVGDKNIKGLQSIAVTMISISGAVLLLAAAMQVLSSVGMDGMIAKILTLTAIMTALVVSAKVMAKGTPQLTKGSLYLLAFSASVSAIIGSLEKLANANLNGIYNNLGTLIVIMGLIVALSAAAKGLSFGDATGITVTILNLLLFVSVLRKIAEIKPTDILKSAATFAVLVSAMAILAVALGLASKISSQDASLLKMAISISIMSATLLLLVEVARQAGEIDPESLSRGVNTVSMFLVLFAIITAASGLANANSDKVGKGILSMSISLIILGLCVKYLGELDKETLLQGIASVSLFLVLFTIISAVGIAANKSGNSIAGLAFVIGVLVSSMVVLTLIDWKELLASSLSLSVVLLAFGAAFKNIKNIKTESILKNVLLFGVIIAGLVASIKILDGVDVNGMIASTASLSLLLLTLSLSSKYMNTIDGRKYSTYIKTIKLMGLFLAEAVLALSVISMIDDADMLKKAVSISILMATMTAIASAISVLKIDTTQSMKGAVGISAIVLILGGLVTLIGALFSNPDWVKYIDNGAEMIQKLGMVTPWIAIFGVIAAAFTYFPVNIGAAITGAAAIDSVITIIGGLVLGLGALNDLLKGKAASWLNDGGEMLASIGSAIGGFIGNLIGSLIGGIATGALPTIATNLGLFSERILPFLENIQQVDKNALDAAQNLADVMSAMQQVASFGDISKNGSVLVSFAESMVKLADPIMTFSDKVSGINIKAVEASSQLIFAITELLVNSPIVGGLGADIFGSKSFKAFDGLEDFAIGIKAYSDTLTANGGINEDAIVSSANVVQILSDMAKGLPKTGGKWQEWFGESDLQKFGKDLVLFGTSLIAYNNLLVGNPINEEIISSSANAASAMVELSNALPKTGGKWQEWFGESDLEKFGKDLTSFGESFVAFNGILVGADPAINPEIIDSSATAGAVMVELSNSLSKTGGKWQEWFGSKDIGNFGTQLSAFGSALVEYAKSLSEIDIDKLTSSTNLLTVLVDLSTKIETTFNDALKVHNGSSKKMEDVGKYICVGIANGITNNQSDLNKTVEKMAKGILSTTKKTLDINSPSKVFKDEVGVWIVKGIASGLEDRDANNTLSKKVVEMATRILTTTQDTLEIESPSVVFKDEVGVWIVKGIAEGITSDMSAEEAAAQKASNIVSAFTDALDKIDVTTSLREALYTYSQWFIPTDISDEDLAELQLKNLDEKMNEQIDRVRHYEAEYKSMLELFGEDAEETKKAYTELINARNDLLSIGDEIATIQNGNVEEQRDQQEAFLEMWSLLNDGVEQDKVTTQKIDEQLHKKLDKLNSELEKASEDDKAGIFLEISKTEAEIEKNRRKGLSTIEQLMELQGVMTDEEIAEIQKQQNILQADIDEWSKQRENTNDEQLSRMLETRINDTQKKIDELEATKLPTIDYYVDYAARMAGYTGSTEPETITAKDVVASYLPDGTDMENAMLWWTDEIELDQTIEAAATKAGSYIGSTMGNATINSFMNTISDGTFNLGDIISSVVGGGDIGLPDNFMEGSIANTVDGIIDTASSFGKKLGDVGTNFFKNISGGYDEEAEIASPSKVMKEKGEYTVRGLINGIENLESAAVTAMERLAKRMIAAFTDMIESPTETVTLASSFTTAISEAASMAENIEPSIGINAVVNLDTSEAERQLSTFQNDVSAQSAAKVNSEVESTKSKLQNGSGTQTGSSNTTVINQTINTPAVATPIEILRRTKNLFSLFIEGV